VRQLSVWVEPPLRAGREDLFELCVVVAVHPDVLAGPEPADKPVVQPVEQGDFLVGDTDERELREAVEGVDDAGVVELVDLVEDDDGPGAVVALEPVDQLVVGGRLAVDVERLAEVVEDGVQRPEAGVVAPAVDVGRIDVEGLLAEALGDELRDASLARPAGAGDDGGVGRLALGDGLEDAGEVVDLGVAMFDLAWDEPGTQHASIANHVGVMRPQLQKCHWVGSGKRSSSRRLRSGPCAISRFHRRDSVNRLFHETNGDGAPSALVAFDTGGGGEPPEHLSSRCLKCFDNGREFHQW
jgi:hypothetical protein